MFITALTILATQLTLANNAQLQNSKQKNIQTVQIVDLIPNKEVLKTSINQHYQKASKALIQEFKYKEKGSLLHYLPSIAYNFIKQSTSISYNSSKLAGAINKGNAKKAKIKSIKKYIQIALEKELEKIHRYYANLEAEINLYNYSVEVYQLKKELFKLKKAQYNNLEISPTEFIKSQIKIKTDKLKLNKKYTSILKLRNHILEIAKFNHYGTEY